MTVKVSATKLITQIRDWQGQGWFEFQNTTPAMDAGSGLFEAVTQVRGSWDPDSDEAFLLEPPVVSANGVVVAFDQAWDPKRFVAFLEMVAGELSQRGYSGTIRSVDYDIALCDGLRGLQSLSATARLTGGPWATTHRDKPIWNLDDATQAAVTDFALQWCQLPDAKYYFATGLVSFECDKSALETLVQAAWGKDHPSIAITAQVDESAIRRVTITSYAYLLFETRSDPDFADPAWSAKVDDLRSVLQALAQHMSYGYIKRAEMGNKNIERSWSSAWPPVESVVRGAGIRSSARLPDMALDAFPIQLVSKTMLDKPLSLEDWTLEDVGNGKSFMTHKAAEDWLRNVPSEEGIAKAREDLKPILMTRELLIDAQKR